MSYIKRGTCLLISIISLSCSSSQIDNYVIDSKYYAPTDEMKNIAIIFLGGSGGKMPRYNYRNFTEKGYPSLALGYFNTKNTPQELEMIPLEYFKKAIDEFKNNPDVVGKKIVVFGTSKGGELVLLLGATFSEIDGVIANVPSSVVFQGISYSFSIPKSSWSYKGRSVPFVPYAKFDFTKIKNNNYLEMYNLSLQKNKAVKKASIKVENINGPLLLLSGEEDIMWPATKMCNDIIDRLKDKDFKYSYEHYSYKSAGHTFYFGNTLSYGGTSQGNHEARQDSTYRVFNFLEELSKI